jgi:hypothetical protein
MTDEANPLGGHEISTQVLQSRVIGKFEVEVPVEVADNPVFRDFRCCPLAHGSRRFLEC